MSIFFLSLVNPYRPHPTGASEDVRRRVEALAAKSDVEVYAVDYADQLSVRGEVPKSTTLKLYKRRFDRRPWRWWLPLPITRRYNRKLVSDLQEVVATAKGMVLIVEGLQCFGIWLDVRESTRSDCTAILRLLNIESAYHAHVMKASSNLIERLANAVTAIQYKGCERLALNQFNEIHTISAFEADQLSSNVSLKTSVRLVPPLAGGWAPCGRTALSKLARLEIGYFGDLTVSTNRHGLEWFINEVLPTLRHVEARLHIAGQGAEYFARFPQARAHGFVHSLPDFACSMDVLIVPLKGGAGVKIKTLDSACFGIPLVATSHAVEGLSPDLVRELWVSDAPSTLAGYLEEITGSYSQALVRSARARKCLLAHHDPIVYAQLISGLLSEQAHDQANGPPG